VRDPLDRASLGQRKHLLGINPRRRQQGLTQRTTEFRHHTLDRQSAFLKQHLAHQRKAVAVDTGRGQPDHGIPGNNLPAVDHLRAIDHAHGKTGQVVLALRIERGHLGGFSTDESATGLTTPVGNPADHGLGRL
jgi:hypothetical protein